MALLGLTSILCLWACLCGAVYGMLRLFGRRFPFALSCLGSIALGLWVWGYLLIVLVAGLSLDSNAPSSYRSMNGVIEIGGLLLFSLVAGGFAVREATQKRMIWWHGVLFCALYIVAAHGLTGLVFAVTGLFDSLDQVMTPISRRLSGADSGFLVGCLVWLFPLGAPISEIALRNFRRVFAANREDAVGKTGDEIR